MTLDMGTVLTLVKEHFESLLVFVLVAIAWWRGGFGQVSSLVAKLESWYDSLRKEAEEKQFYEIARKAYEFADNQARQLAKKTATDVDDKIVDKTTIALGWALKAMKKAGLDSKDSEDVLKGYFAHFNEAERKAEAFSGNLPAAPKPADKT